MSHISCAYLLIKCHMLPVYGPESILYKIFILCVSSNQVSHVSSSQIWCSVNSTPRSKDSTFITVFDPSSYEKKLHYTNLESRVSVILPVDNSVSRDQSNYHNGHWPSGRYSLLTLPPLSPPPFPPLPLSITDVVWD